MRTRRLRRQRVRRICGETTETPEQLLPSMTIKSALAAAARQELDSSRRCRRRTIDSSKAQNNEWGDYAAEFDAEFAPRLPRGRRRRRCC